jgi:hypothetical protein
VKKICACMAVCLCFAGVSAFADATAVQDMEFYTYKSVDAGYQIEYPVDWTQLSIDTIDEVITQIANGEIVIEGFTQAALETMKATISGGTNIGFVEFIDWDGNNYNVNCFSYPTPPSIEEANETLSPQIVLTYQSLFSDLTVLDGGSVGSTGDYDYIRIKCQYVIMDSPVIVTSMFIFNKGMVYNICFTWITSDEGDLQTLDQIMERALASFVLP